MKKNENEKKNTQLDEMQEQKLLKIEHYGCWFAFWGLLICILVQLLIGGDNSQEALKSVAGEWIVFMCLAVYLAIACLRNGIWDRKFKPSIKTNLLFSVAAGLIVGVIWFVRSYMNYHKLAGSAATGIFMFVQCFVLCMLFFALATSIYKKRKNKLENPEDEE